MTYRAKLDQQEDSRGNLSGVSKETGRIKKNLPLALLVGMRPKQWLKNLIVLAAPLAAAKLTDPKVLVPSLVAVLSFILASSGIYLLNDLKDVEADRMHPKKRHRAIASGDLPKGVAYPSAVVLLALSLAVSTIPGWYQLVVVMACYIALNIAYVYWTKTEPMLDMMSVASGFLLRAIAGGAASHIPLSNWFLIVASFGSLLMVTGKRSSEIRLLGTDAGQHRSALTSYSANYLYFIAAVAAGITITAYCLWAFERSGLAPNKAILYEVSIVPFVLGIFRYALLIDKGEAGAPEDLVLSDNILRVIGVIWIALLALSVYI
ncbi:MAG: decaprenyl-phosphate phosphoribosyltransferase [Acidimicrobiaceae bacterium]|nr:decaprenyl-phosphate phosphoribosyltransferase [Acidimicrobiaceae bacterium]